MLKTTYHYLSTWKIEKKTWVDYRNMLEMILDDKAAVLVLNLSVTIVQIKKKTNYIILYIIFL